VAAVENLMVGELGKDERAVLHTQLRAAVRALSVQGV
jgi:hypothetical protein